MKLLDLFLSYLFFALIFSLFVLVIVFIDRYPSLSLILFCTVISYIIIDLVIKISK